jgi:hypothetical protein
MNPGPIVAVLACVVAVLAGTLLYYVVAVLPPPTPYRPVTAVSTVCVTEGPTFACTTTLHSEPPKHEEPFYDTSKFMPHPPTPAAQPDLYRPRG